MLVRGGGRVRVPLAVAGVRVVEQCFNEQLKSCITVQLKGANRLFSYKTIHTNFSENLSPAPIAEI